MDSALEEIYRRIPHRPPFLWVDRIVSISRQKIEVEKTIPEDLDLFQGHYPGNPIVPGVILSEAVFQAGSLLISEHISDDLQGVPVLTRIHGAKFKRIVRPGEKLAIHVLLDEIIGPAWMMKGKVLVNGKIALKVDFSCAVTNV